MKLLLIDGNAIMHRAFHALPPLTNTDGQLTNAVHGFTNMLFTVIDKFHPTHLIVCFDRPEPTFRKSMYVGYQAHRPKMDDGLSSQFGLVKEILSAMKIPVYEQAGFEADDVMGTLAHQASNQQPTINNQHTCSTIIVTGDRDILQLVNQHVFVYMPVQGLNNGKLYDEKAVEEKFGIRPSQIIDYKALVGDASDNYPGVRGIGPKTASELLQQFGTGEALYEGIKNKDSKAQRLKEKTIKALSEYAEDAGMAKQLATIRRDVPVTIDLDKAELHDLGTPEAIEVLERLGMKTTAGRLMAKEKTGNGTNEQISNISNKQDAVEQMTLL